MKERVCGLLAFTGDRPVGVIMMSDSAAFFARGTYATITELYVVPDQRSSGVAMRLIEAAVELGMVKGWTQLELAAPRQPMWSRNPGLALYVKAGFCGDRPAPAIAVAVPRQLALASQTQGTIAIWQLAATRPHQLYPEFCCRRSGIGIHRKICCSKQASSTSREMS